MSNNNYIAEMLELKDKNVKFYDNFYKKEKIKEIITKIFEGYLSYIPSYCTKCGVMFDNNIEKRGFITSDIRIPNVSGYKAILRLHKQRYLCKHCNKAFILISNITNYGCFISNSTKWNIAKDLTKKRSEKDIAIDNNVSSNTVERVMDSFYDNKKLYKNYLPNVLFFDEFKSVKSADGAMSFHMCNGITGKTIDIVENRQLLYLLKYFSYYSFKARKNVKLVIIDMYDPYVSLIKKMFPNAKIVIDKFHLIQLISRSLNQTRIKVMNNDKNNYKKLKRYWRLFLKNRDNVDYLNWKRFTCFSHLLTESDVLNYMLNNTNPVLKETYLVYQKLLDAFNRKDFDLLIKVLNEENNKVSSYMKASLNTLKTFLPHIENTFKYDYNNGYIEGNNNFIKVLKRIAFGYRSFKRFKARIMICKGLININKKIANTYQC